MIWDHVRPIVQELVDDHSDEEWQRLFNKWDEQTWHDVERPTEQTSVLMVDAHAVTTEGEPNLDALHDLLKEHVQASISDLYLVSLFPYTNPPSDTRINPRIRLLEDLGRFRHEFGLMYDAEPDVYNETQFDVLKETDLVLERLAQGASALRVHIQSFRGMPEDRIHLVLTLWYRILHHYKPEATFVLAYEGTKTNLSTYFGVADAICHFDFASHVLLAFAQGDASRLRQWAKYEAPPEGKTYFNFLSSPERDPFEKNLLHPTPEQILAAHSILFSLRGIPAVDYRTLLGVTTPVDQATLIHDLKTDPFRLNVFTGIISQLNVRRTHPAFSPYATERILKTDKRVFAVERTGDNERVTTYTNISHERVTISITGTNIFTGEAVEDVTLEPYEHVWITK